MSCCVCKQFQSLWQPVSKILLDGQQAVGVVLEDGQEVTAKAVLSNATPKVTFLDLLDEVRMSREGRRVVHHPVTYPIFPFQSSLPATFLKEVKSIDYTSSVTKINGEQPYTL